MKLYDAIEGESTRAVAECDAMNNVYSNDFQCRTGFLPGGQGKILVMPYMFPLPTNMRHFYLKNGRITRALRWLASKLLRHLDIKWRHIGLREENAKKVYFLDFGETEALTPADGDAFVEASLKLLTETAGLPESCDQEALLVEACKFLLL